MAWQQCTVWRPVRESKAASLLPELSGLGRTEVGPLGVGAEGREAGGSDCAGHCDFSLPLAEPRWLQEGSQRKSVSTLWGSSSELNQSQAVKEEGWG